MRCHISNKTAYPEPEKPAAEAVKTATVAEKDTKKANDSDNRSQSSGSVEVVNDNKGDGKVASSYSKSSAKSEEEEEVYNGTPEKPNQGDVENTVARGVSGTRLLVGSRFAGDKCVCWWEVVLLVKRRFAGEKCVCW